MATLARVALAIGLDIRALPTKLAVALLLAAAFVILDSSTLLMAAVEAALTAVTPAAAPATVPTGPAKDPAPPEARIVPTVLADVIEYHNASPTACALSLKPISSEKTEGAFFSIVE